VFGTVGLGHRGQPSRHHAWPGDIAEVRVNDSSVTYNVAAGGLGFGIQAGRPPKPSPASSTWVVNVGYAAGPLRARSPTRRPAIGAVARLQGCGRLRRSTLGFVTLFYSTARTPARCDDRKGMMSTGRAPRWAPALKRVVRHAEVKRHHDAKRLALGYHYSMSKRTTLYVDFATTTAKPRHNKSGYDVGIKHNVLIEVAARRLAQLSGRPSGGLFHEMRTFVRPLLSTLLALAGCATPPPPSDTAGWQPVALPGKRSTSYDWTTKEGRPALRARADQSASLLRRTLTIDPDALGDVRFSWWVDAPLPGADLAAAGLGDSPARILFAFDGNHSTLSARNRLLFDLAESVGGERPPTMLPSSSGVTPPGVCRRWP
jgi:hypothetical protein